LLHGVAVFSLPIPEEVQVYASVCNRLGAHIIKAQTIREKTTVPAGTIIRSIRRSRKIIISPLSNLTWRGVTDHPIKD
jgi:hypothetical protein